MKKIWFLVFFMSALLFTGVRSAAAQGGYTFEMLLEGLKNISGAKVQYSWWSITRINDFNQKEDLTGPKRRGCVAKITYPIGMALLDELLNWKTGSVNSIGGLYSGNAYGKNYHMIRVDDNYCRSGKGGGGSGGAIVPETTVSFQALALFALVITLILLGLLRSGLRRVI